MQIFFKDFVQFYISEKKVMHQFLHYVASITFFCMSSKHDVSSQSSFNIALKTLEKSTHFMLTHVTNKRSKIPQNFVTKQISVPNLSKIPQNWKEFNKIESMRNCLNCIHYNFCFCIFIFSDNVWFTRYTVFATCLTQFYQSFFFSYYHATFKGHSVMV